MEGVWRVGAVFRFGLVVGLIAASVPAVRSARAQELSESAAAPSAFTTVIDPREFDDRFATLEDLLDETPGVRVRRFGGLGEHSTASIRGSKSEQVLVLLDGVRLNSARDGSVDLSSLPLASLERIEILRGSGASRYGSDAVGGVISLTSRAPEPGSALDVSATAGRWDTLGVDSYASLGTERFRSLVGYSRLRSDNDFRFERSAQAVPGTIFGPGLPGGEVRNTRVGASFAQDSALWSATLDSGPDSQWASTLRYFGKDRGQPGNVRSATRLASDDSVSCTHADESLERWVGSLAWRRRDIAGGDVELSGYHRSERDSLHDPFSQNELFNLCGFLSGTLRDEVDSVDQQSGGELRFVPDVRRLGPLTLAGEGSLGMRFDHLRASSSDPAQRHIENVSLRPELQLFEGLVRLLPALGIESAHTREIDSLRQPGTGAQRSVPRSDGTETTPSIGAIVGLGPGLQLKSNYGRAFRRPTFTESFHPDYGFIRGNPDLVPEESWNFDAGFEFASLGAGPLSDLRLEAVYFRRDIDHAIEFVQINQSTFAPRNLDPARARGYELSASLSLFDRLDLDGAYTYLDTRLRSNGEPMPHRPRNQLFGRATLRASPFLFWVESSYESSFTLSEEGSLVAPSAQQVDLGLSLRATQVPWLDWLPGDMVISSEWLDVTHSERIDSLGLPLPDRGWYLRIHGAWR